MHNEAYQKSLSRTNQGDGLDFWRTPPQATEALLKREKFIGTILEPACGTGDMSQILMEKYGDSVVSSDIVDRGYSHHCFTEDFLSKTKDNNYYGNVITNPPFNLAEEFIIEALRLSNRKVAMLLKLEFLQSIKRFELFKNTPLKVVYIFSYRVPFWQHGYDKPINNQRHAWYVWDNLYYDGSTKLEWIGVPEGGVDKNWWKKLA